MHDAMGHGRLAAQYLQTEDGRWEKVRRVAKFLPPRGFDVHHVRVTTIRDVTACAHVRQAEKDFWHGYRHDNRTDQY